MLKALICDVDNTLTDFIGMKKRCCTAAIEAMRRHGLTLSVDDALQNIFRIYDEEGWEEQEVFQKLIEKYHGKPDYRILAAGIVAYRNARPFALVPYADVREALEMLRAGGIKLAVVSDAPRLKAHIRLETIGLIKYFPHIITYDDTQKLKPDEAPFRLALERLGISPTEALFIGDNPGRDIVGARTVGMKTCWARYGCAWECEDPKADYTADSFRDVLLVLRNV
ncbi:HAD-IA family hydrolase [Candidatus Woesearchaeota archaeon]|nr:HAD-IA family hydrolase [Candidatus Woesearchaeota archaeon]HIH37385.1 HAD-IA family hydrolase [Candidatus Woesearchaeota archaeon]HIH48394.1 HAD-IA family hydrolase [Candidatus Woesearchaeota archaeon]HIJ04225.1 HAD-IA family hydrolase [Candidatus Woesearchaeota archaeon]